MLDKYKLLNMSSSENKDIIIIIICLVGPIISLFNTLLTMQASHNAQVSNKTNNLAAFPCQWPL